jgi:dTDP-4-dehydrorhamnose reductase
MTKVLVLGGSGMLGSMVADVLSRNRALTVTATVRDPDLLGRLRLRLPEVEWRRLHLEDGAAGLDVVRGHSWVVNAIGITKPLIHDDSPAEIERAIEVNSLFPHLLGHQAARVGARILQIATDCVYSGARGRYVETDVHDALDVYGKTKSLGESFQGNVAHLRCSIIGPEPKAFKFLIEWFRRQPPGARANGFLNHHWNGLTTLHFARLCESIIASGLELPHLHHVVPADSLSKAAMLHLFAETFARPDVSISDVDAPTVVDRTLRTLDPDLNRRLWQCAGYAAPPSVADMIRELARFDYRAA